MAAWRAVVGVGGGIAAYKAAELVRALAHRGIGPQVVMTAAAQEFVRPLTFAALTGRKVITSMFGSTPEEVLSSSVEHIGVARENDLLIVAPATADLLAKFAHGLADDFLSTLYLAFERQVLLAPSMNTSMWRHVATQDNVAALRRRGHVVMEPEEGALACGETGPGRLPEPERIAEEAHYLLARRHDLEGETVLVTAGPTREPLDPVRFLSNRSSGKMGYALAEAAAWRGARVILISGPVDLTPPLHVETVRVETARQMRDAVMSRLPECSIVIKSAAVADYHVAQVPAQKLKKTATRLSLELDPTPDILAEAGAEIERAGRGQLLIGFAAETENVVAEAKRKLKAKRCHMVVANNVGAEGLGFESDENQVTLVTQAGDVIELERGRKRELADRILDEALRLRLALYSRS
ncbi:MAG: bifunctional phosphopantothenoylcysteine decarboxylase/phosphopantothenate--cysteine ligase CoaBC [Bryobacteraceae bacterium]